MGTLHTVDTTKKASMFTYILAQGHIKFCLNTTREAEEPIHGDTNLINQLCVHNINFSYKANSRLQMYMELLDI